MKNTSTAAAPVAKKRTAALGKGAGIATLVLALMLGGGGTYALWSDSDSDSIGRITAGSLEVELTGAGTWKDISADRTDSGHSIDLDIFKITPGDTIQGTFGVDSALEGENLVAELGVMIPGGTSDLLTDAKGITVTYSVVKADTGVPVGGATDLPLGTDATSLFTSLDNTAGFDLPTLPKSLDGVEDLEVIVTASFDASAYEADLHKATADLSDLEVTLEQTRASGSGAGF